ncbi:hypothetical protein LguiB_022067 [Lonicera macranthoides]
MPPSSSSLSHPTTRTSCRSNKVLLLKNDGFLLFGCFKQLVSVLVKKERAKANAAYLELEKERMASSTAAEEAMAMILRLHNKKSLIELEANHYRRLAEEKQQHDQEVIQSLQWIVMKHESERSVLEERLRICRQKLKIYMKGDDEGDHCEGFDEFLGFSNANFEDDLYL